MLVHWHKTQKVSSKTSIIFREFDEEKKTFWFPKKFTPIFIVYDNHTLKLIGVWVSDNKSVKYLVRNFLRKISFSLNFFVLGGPFYCKQICVYEWLEWTQYGSKSGCFHSSWKWLLFAPNPTISSQISYDYSQMNRWYDARIFACLTCLHEHCVAWIISSTAKSLLKSQQ